MEASGAVDVGHCIHIVDVSKRFTAGGRMRQALDGVNVRVRGGVITGLVGPDGAGKTTLMRLIAGLLVPEQGRIDVLGFDSVRDSLAVQAVTGYMPQRFGLYEDLTVQENLDLYADLHGVPRGRRPERYAQLTRMTGLARFTGRLAGKLSGGMKQKLGLACTLVHPPDLLLLDEPTAGVDPLSRRELWSIVEHLVGEAGVSVLLSTAYLDEAERCDEVLVLYGGRLLVQDTPAGFKARMRNRSFLATGVTGASKRRLHTRLAAAPGVVDATVHGEHLRVVMAEAQDADAAAGATGLEGLQLTPVPPRFEDAFIAIVKSQAGSQGATPSMLSAPAAIHPGAGDVIVVKDVQRRFGDFYAVKDISFSVRHGEIFGLLGANGAGKSTTFRMLCGLLPASAGLLRVAGEDLRRAAPRARARIGYMAQRFSLYVNLSVLQNLRFFASAYGLRGHRRGERIHWALETFELHPFADTASGNLPLGYKQLLALAAALMHEPEILFLDEPTSGVDPLARREFWRHIIALAEAGVTVLVTTHFMEEANYCDRLVIMADGEILAQGTPNGLKAPFRSAECPDPDMEDAFIGLIEARAENKAA
jgi:ABC-2 type transport system ATP-binding protein